MNKEDLLKVFAKKIYLGDSVYAEHDGFNLVLTTNNGYSDDPRNRIALEPALLAALDSYRVMINNAIKEYRESEAKRHEALP